MLVLVACAVSYGFWLYSVYSGQLNNTSAVQRCALHLEANRAEVLVCRKRSSVWTTGDALYVTTAAARRTCS